MAARGTIHLYLNRGSSSVHAQDFPEDEETDDLPPPVPPKPVPPQPVPLARFPGPPSGEPENNAGPETISAPEQDTASYRSSTSPSSREPPFPIVRTPEDEHPPQNNPSDPDAFEVLDEGTGNTHAAFQPSVSTWTTRSSSLHSSAASTVQRIHDSAAPAIQRASSSSNRFRFRDRFHSPSKRSTGGSSAPPSTSSRPSTANSDTSSNRPLSPRSAPRSRPSASPSLNSPRSTSSHVSIYGIRVPKGVSSMAFGRPLLEATIDTNTGQADPQPGRAKVNRRREEARPWLPAVAYRCLEYIDSLASVEQGIYRVPGSSKSVADLRVLYDAGCDIDLLRVDPSDIEPHAVASLFKAWLRELPESILSSPIERDIDHILIHHTGSPAISRDLVQMRSDGTGPRAHGPLPMEVLREMAELLEGGLPKQNYYLLREIAYHLGYLADRSHVNKMTLSNLRLILSPTLRLSPVCLQIFVEERDTLFPVTERNFSVSSTSSSIQNSNIPRNPSPSSSTSSQQPSPFLKTSPNSSYHPLHTGSSKALPTPTGLVQSVTNEPERPLHSPDHESRSSPVNAGEPSGTSMHSPGLQSPQPSPQYLAPEHSSGRPQGASISEDNLTDNTSANRPTPPPSSPTPIADRFSSSSSGSNSHAPVSPTVPVSATLPPQPQSSPKQFVPSRIHDFKPIFAGRSEFPKFLKGKQSLPSLSSSSKNSNKHMQDALPPPPLPKDEPTTTLTMNSLGKQSQSSSASSLDISVPPTNGRSKSQDSFNAPAPASPISIAADSKDVGPPEPQSSTALKQEKILPENGGVTPTEEHAAVTPTMDAKPKPSDPYPDSKDMTSQETSDTSAESDLRNGDIQSSTEGSAGDEDYTSHTTEESVPPKVSFERTSETAPVVSLDDIGSDFGLLNFDDKIELN